MAQYSKAPNNQAWMVDWHKTLALTLASHKQCLVSLYSNGFKKVSITAG